MKRAFVLAAAVPVTAAVAKDAKRKAVVTVTRGSARTVRAPSKFRRLRVGQRVAVDARTLPDGTYAAATVRGQGRVSQVRFRGIVVRHDRRARRLILSAGDSVFAARMAGRSTSLLELEGIFLYASKGGFDMKSETAVVEGKA